MAAETFLPLELTVTRLVMYNANFGGAILFCSTGVQNVCVAAIKLVGIKLSGLMRVSYFVINFMLRKIVYGSNRKVGRSKREKVESLYLFLQVYYRLHCI